LNPFEKSADFYDELYAGKDYAAEADYVHALVQEHLPGARSVLDLGCGTGRHAIKFAEKGYTVVGVDRSPEMIARARDHRERLLPEIRERLRFERCAIRDLRLDNRFDAVVSLFHVISYQTSNDDLIAAFTSAKTHLGENGVFIFDCWYGPGVLTDPPTVRTKTLDTGPDRLTRVAEPMMRVNDNTVELNLRFELLDKSSQRCSKFGEVHRMRYFFAPELSLALQMTGFDFVILAEWMTGRVPDRTTWSISVVAQSQA